MFFPKLILTDAGKALIVKALNGTTIHFTKFALGDGVKPEEPRKLVELVHLVANMEINSMELSANCAVLESTYINSGLKQKLVAREIGIFAQDPDAGEILYAYSNAGEEASTVPADNGECTIQETFHFAVAVGDAESVTATIGEYSGYAGKKDLQDHKEDHQNPHHVTAEQVGLGNVPNVSPANQQPVFDAGYITKEDSSFDVQNIESGEKLGNILRKIRTAIAAFVAHIAEKNPHNISAEGISAAERNHNHNTDDVTEGVFPISRGGTGAATATEAREKLGIMPITGGIFTGTVNFGSSEFYVNTSGEANFSKCFGAWYNDFAEFFPRGCNTQPGDVIALDVNSSEERYILATDKSSRVVGIHSDEFAILIGGEPPLDDENYIKKNIEHYIPVALAGRVKTRVVGPIRTGDIILPSDIPGVGRAAKTGESYPSACVAGYAVEGDERTDVRRIRIRVRG